jgi:hypothetical protein
VWVWVWMNLKALITLYKNRESLETEAPVKTNLLGIDGFSKQFDVYILR